MRVPNPPCAMKTKAYCMGQRMGGRHLSVTTALASRGRKKTGLHLGGTYALYVTIQIYVVSPRRMSLHTNIYGVPAECRTMAALHI